MRVIEYGSNRNSPPKEDLESEELAKKLQEEEYRNESARKIVTKPRQNTNGRRPGNNVREDAIDPDKMTYEVKFMNC